MPFFTIITPTLQRSSLATCCASIDRQTWYDWEHIVQVDAERIDMHANIFGSATRRRWVVECGEHHNDYGNTCRNLAWRRATGDWVIHLDDDNVLAYDGVLADIADTIAGMEKPVAVFPILRHGHYFFSDPPRTCHIDTANIVARREVARWPKIPDYTADGQWAEAMVAAHGCVGFPHASPIIHMPVSSEGKQ